MNEVYNQRQILIHAIKSLSDVLLERLDNEESTNQYVDESNLSKRFFVISINLFIKMIICLHQIF